MPVLITIFKHLLSLASLVAVVWLGKVEAQTWQDISISVYAILAGVVFGLSGEELIKILSIFKKQ